MTTKHTPGPWDGSDSRWPNCIVSQKGTDGALSLVRVAEVRYANPADFTLMISAPNLLSALVELFDRVEAEGVMESFPEYDKARIAIAQARGET